MNVLNGLLCIFPVRINL